MPAILDKAAEEKDNQKQFSHIIAVFIAGINNFLNLKQPLNPILGETHNCFIGTTEVFLEQISHHPPVSAYYMKNEKWTCYGQVELKPSIGMPHVYIYALRDQHVVFNETGNHYIWNNPYIRIKGIVTGTRKMIVEGKIGCYLL